jgi:heat shock protein HslJ
MLINEASPPLNNRGRLRVYVNMRLDRAPRRAALGRIAGILLAILLAACSGATGQLPPGQPPTGQPSTTAAFVGYKWAVTSISHAGQTTPVPGSYSVYLQFAPNGGFLANEPVNSHSGTYQVTQGGFTIGDLGSTLVGYVGHDPVVLVSMSAMEAFDGAPAQASVSGNTLTVTVGGYTLIAQRDGKQANF